MRFGARGVEATGSTSIAIVLIAVALGGCPGTLDHKERFLTNGDAGDDAGDGGSCDAERDLFASTEVGRGCSQPGTCHAGNFPPDLSMPDVAGRLGDAPGVGTGCDTFKYIDLTTPENSLLYKKVTDDFGCGAKMPFGQNPLPQEDIDCILQWAQDHAN